MVWLLVGWVAVRLWAFFLLGFHLAACFPYGWLVRQLGGLVSHFSLPCSFGVVVGSMVLGRGFCRGSPLRVVSSCSFLEGSLPPLWRWRVWLVESSRPIRSSGRYPWCLFASILFPSCATRGRFAVPGVLVSGSGLSASACSHACGRFRGIAPRSWCWLSIRLSSWWKGRLMGRRLVIVPLPGRLCLFTPFSVEICRFGAISPRVVGLFFLLCLSVYCRKWWYLSSRKLVGVPVGFTSSSPLLGGVLFDLVPILSWVFSPRVWSGFLPLSGGTTPVWFSAAF